MTDRVNARVDPAVMALNSRMLAASAALQPAVVLPPANGTIHRPLRDVEPDSNTSMPKQPANARLLPEEHQHIHASSRPRAQLAARAAQITAEVHSLDMQAPGYRDRRAQLYEQSVEIEREMQGDARSTARVACLHAVEAGATRAAQRYITAARMLADAAAQYQAHCQLHDAMLGLNRFDPLGIWHRSKLLAPEPRHRPQRMHVVPDANGVECVWYADSPHHNAQVHAESNAIRSELNIALNGSGWPFN